MNDDSEIPPWALVVMFSVLGLVTAAFGWHESNHWTSQIMALRSPQMVEVEGACV